VIEPVVLEAPAGDGLARYEVLHPPTGAVAVVYAEPGLPLSTWALEDGTCGVLDHSDPRRPVPFATYLPLRR
jgi:hypothetical protein